MLKHLFFEFLILWQLVKPNSLINELFYRNKVKDMFIHAYDGYTKHAYPLDELKPISCKGMNTWGNFSLSLIDVLDTLIIMGNYTEYIKAKHLILDNINFDMDINVSLFETNIRIVGGLLGAHFLEGSISKETWAGYPCNGPLLTLAKQVADKLIPAFDTATGLPYGTINLKKGVPSDETPVTCTASCTTYILEFWSLSALTGDPKYKDIALKALDSMWSSHRSKIGLVGNHINTRTGEWTNKEAGIGSGVDSYFEYLIKGAFLMKNPIYLKMFKDYEKSINKYINYNDWYFWVNMDDGRIIWTIFQSLEAFWPGLLVSLGEISAAEKSFKQYHYIWMKYGSLPETFNVLNGEYENGHANYPLRPEFIESAYHLFKATGNPYYQKVGIDVIESLELLCKTSCGYAVLKHVGTGEKDDRMESFFLSETLKYLYLLFDPDNSYLNNNIASQTARYIISSEFQNSTSRRIDELKEVPTESVVLYTNFETHKAYNYSRECMVTSDGYIFNTEAHPIHMSAVECCNILNSESPKSVIAKNSLYMEELSPEDLFNFDNMSQLINHTLQNLNKLEDWMHSLGTPLTISSLEDDGDNNDYALNDILAILKGDYSALNRKPSVISEEVIEQKTTPDNHDENYIFDFDEYSQDLAATVTSVIPSSNLGESLLAKANQLTSSSGLFNILKDILANPSIIRGQQIKIGLGNGQNFTHIDQLMLSDTSLPPKLLKGRGVMFDFCASTHLEFQDYCLNFRWALNNFAGYDVLDVPDKTPITTKWIGKFKFSASYFNICLFRFHRTCCPARIYFSNRDKSHPPSNNLKELFSSKNSHDSEKVSFDYFRRLAKSKIVIDGSVGSGTGNVTEKRKVLMILVSSNNDEDGTQQLDKPFKGIKLFGTKFTNPKNLLCNAHYS